MPTYYLELRTSSVTKVNSVSLRHSQFHININDCRLASSHGTYFGELHCVQGVHSCAALKTFLTLGGKSLVLPPYSCDVSWKRGCSWNMFLGLWVMLTIRFPGGQKESLPLNRHFSFLISHNIFFWLSAVQRFGGSSSMQAPNDHHHYHYLIQFQSQKMLLCLGAPLSYKTYNRLMIPVHAFFRGFSSPSWL